MIALLFKALHSRVGIAIQWLVGTVVGWLTLQAVGLGVDMPAEEWDKLTKGLSLIGAFIVSFAVQWYQAKMAAKVQSAIGAKVDSWIGKDTLANIEDLAGIAKKVALNSTLPRQP